MSVETIASVRVFGEWFYIAAGHFGVRPVFCMIVGWVLALRAFHSVDVERLHYVHNEEINAGYN